MSLWNKVFGDPNDKDVARIRATVVEAVNAVEDEYTQLSDEALFGKTAEFKQQIADGTPPDDLVVPAFATVREAARRVLGMRHFDVQLIGGYALHTRQIAEMKTGEGKTLVGTLPVYLHALMGQGAHVVTVNDYLAKRDACWMGQLYSALGLSVSIIQNQQASFRYDPENNSQDYLDRVAPCSRAEAYQADITYGTNNEFGFDYLRDNMAVDPAQRVQRPLAFALVDEIDSILIDEARTPLIISAPAQESIQRYFQFARLVEQLRENEDYNVDEKAKAATLTEEGIEKLEKALGIENIYVDQGLSTVHHIEQALKANVLFKKDRDYVVQDGQIVIVDEFTGRMMPGRRYSEGLHQAIEAKEGVQVQRESQTLATVTFQNYFRMYKHLCGMTGTAATEEEEFHQIYNLGVLVIPTNKPLARQDLNDQIYKSEKGKFQAVIKMIKELHDKGQPVLVGTISIEKNELLSNMLDAAGVPHQMLNAKQHEREADIIAQAGRKGAVTLATNMAGRGVDIILGGKPPAKDDPAYQQWQADHDEILALGGLAVLGTERHESRRIDNQLRGRSGRQGDPGMSRFYLSLQDDLMRIFGPDRLSSIMTSLKVPEDMPIENKLVTNAIESAQKKVEGHNFDIRKHLVQYDDVMNKQRETIYRRRRAALEGGDEVKEEFLGMLREEIDSLVTFHTPGDQISDWNTEEIYEVADTLFGVPADTRIKLDDIEELKNKGTYRSDEARTALQSYLYELAVAAFNDLAERISAASGSEDTVPQVQKAVYLRTIDTLWVEHLDAMQQLRQGIGLRGYGQRDPLIEYKKEGFRLFQQLLALIRQQSISTLFKIGVAGQEMNQSLLDRQGVSLSGAAKQMRAAANLAGAPAGVVQAKAPKEPGMEKVGRNDPCPCGATKSDGTPVKYKKCHGV